MTTIIPPSAAVQSIMEHVPIGVVAFSADLMVLGASRHARAMLDFTSRELVGVSLADAIAKALGDDAARNLGLYAAEVIASQRPTPWRSCRLSAGDGQRFVDWEVRPMAIDGATGVLLTLIDVTEREQAKMTITAAEKSLRLFSEAVVDHALITTNIHGVITDCNNGATLLTGFARQDLVGKSYSLLYAPEDLVNGIPQTELKTAASQGSAKQQRWLQRQGGARFFADGTITAHNLSDELPSFTIAFRDTTAAVRRAEELERVSAKREVAIDALASENADLQQFALVAAHDMQEPLRMVSGYLDILRTRYSGALDDRATEYIDFAINGVLRMGRLIRSLLDISRIDHGEIHPADVSADEAFDEAMKNLSRVITETKASVQRSTLGIVHADRDMLVRLFQNLVGNALKFVVKGVPPKVLVDVRAQTGARAILVKDHGIGVSPEDQGRIFEAFERIHGRGEYMGSGLGLAICKGIVQRHGGELSIESTLGQGATFIFTLPAAKG